ncbi:hypothetical protein HY29_02000 [Hyphomonas beringensis]|uniref:DUF6161 domain-containing protein n=1 Tax=Hyphomonas beringensis TaxID=1280946 RepID=A0A062UBA3_9PROT|nr:DUF6161 domain-containing protein [Hyphomonas beringensis]KCZ55003.1 hypothetical protein HY29_02000 [Hyphomonas beringensis]
MDENSDINLEVSGKGFKLEFRTEDDLKEYLSAHQNFCSQFDLKKIQKVEYGRAINQKVDRAKSIVTRVSSYMNSADAKNLIEKEFSENFPPYTTPVAQHLHDIYEQDGPHRFAGALMAYTNYNYTPNFSAPDLLKGFVKLCLYEESIDQVSAAASRKSLEEIRRLYQRRLNSDGKKYEKALTDISETHQQLSTSIENSSFAWNHNFSKFQSQARAKLQDTTSSFLDFQKSYEDSLRLSRPRKYWSKKATDHNKAARRYRLSALGWLVIAGALTVFGLWELFLYAKENFAVSEDQTPLPISLLITLGAMGLVGTSVFFWVGRLLVRLWLSELHLAMDASERVTMIESFLALRASGTVSDEERQLVLAALFRPTQDGIVKDDASADPLITALASRILR